LPAEPGPNTDQSPYDRVAANPVYKPDGNQYGEGDDSRWGWEQPPDADPGRREMPQKTRQSNQKADRNTQQYQSGDPNILS